ncbi:unnamed protein product, partial [Pylaiella littoralis]
GFDSTLARASDKELSAPKHDRSGLRVGSRVLAFEQPCHFSERRWRIYAGVSLLGTTAVVSLFGTEWWCMYLGVCRVCHLLERRRVGIFYLCVSDGRCYYSSSETGASVESASVAEKVKHGLELRFSWEFWSSGRMRRNLATTAAAAQQQQQQQSFIQQSGTDGGFPQNQRQRCQQQQQQPTPRACSQQSPQVKSQVGAGRIFDCGGNAVYFQPDLPKVYTAGMAYACGRCGRHGHNATYCAAPKRFEGHCWTCGEYGHTSRFCAVKR